MGSCYSLIGNNSMLINKRITEIEEKLDCDKIIFNMDETSLITLLEEIQTIPFLEENKLVIIKRCDFLYGKKCDEKLLEAFINYLKNPLETTTLIIILDKEIDKKNIFSEIKKHTIVDNLKPLTGGEIDDFIKGYLQEQKFIISKRAIDELIQRTENKLSLLLVELDKLMLYKNDEKHIEIDDVLLLVNKNLEENIYNLIDEVLQKNRSRIMEIYQDMMVLNEEETRIISALLQKFNEMHDVRNLVENGYNQNDIATLYNFKSGRVFYMMKNAKMVSMKDIKKNINYLADLDYKIKSGKIDKRIGLELYLLSI